jgi:dTDP-glucose pyrophosphorylase
VITYVYSSFLTAGIEEIVVVDDKSSHETENSEARDNDTSIQRQTEGDI